MKRIVLTFLVVAAAGGSIPLLLAQFGNRCTAVEEAEEAPVAVPTIKTLPVFGPVLPPAKAKDSPRKPTFDPRRVTFPADAQGMERPDTSTEAERRAVVEGNNAFALDLYRRLARENKGRNLVLSPYSVRTALAMVHAGARNETADEMAKALRLSLPQEKLHSALAGVDRRLREGWTKKGAALHTGNALWLQRGFPVEEGFLELLGRSYRAGVGFADFEGHPAEATEAVNLWIEEQTRGMIRAGLPNEAVNPLTRMLLASTIYLKADWQTPFATRATRTKPFHTNAKETVRVPVMNATLSAEYTEGEKFQALRLRYSRGAGEMILLLPKAVDGLAELETKLSPTALMEVTKKMGWFDVDVGIPRFRLSTDLRLAKNLHALGMRTLFSTRADLEGVSKREKVRVEEVYHSARIDATEKGTEAAAVTVVAVGILTGWVEPQRARFHADRPFLFLIRDPRTSTILFIGRVMNPALKK